jgi:hypothetical protein
MLLLAIGAAAGPAAAGPLADQPMRVDESRPGHHTGDISRPGSRPWVHRGFGGADAAPPASRWHSGGFGGTLNPGWGYRFGPTFGGFGGGP